MRSLFMMAPAIILSACTALPEVGAGASPADAGVAVPPARYTPVLAGTTDYRPVAPKSWTDSNRQVAPKEKGK
ncbi:MULTISPECIES: hypothetical protein [Phyllobacteriaceae]|jgi:hypothetical protein|nr:MULTISPECIES: hypothetical protein [Mesorhizobium]MBN9233693.1 hypothetical protein [Mesorhizobium sp.]MDQ0328499.1 hypothetical protein [Mesorhizobium sp. YL-MeA3-2017]